MSADNPRYRELPPEVYLSPEFWDGHSLEDDCEWRALPSGPSKGLITAMKELGKEIGTSNAAEKILREYLELPDHTPIRTFTDGATFDGHLYPEGTIIRFDEDSLYNDKKPRYLHSIRWGVVIRPEGEMEPVIVHWSEGLMYGTKPGPHSLQMKPVVETKAVDHRRRQSGLGLGPSESLKRINTVQIMKQGIGIAREVKVEKKGWLGRVVHNEG